MLGPAKCPKCNGEMAVGFLFTEGYANTHTLWVEGPVELGVFSGAVKTRDRETRRVRSYRCKGCAYLESYAQESAR